MSRMYIPMKNLNLKHVNWVGINHLSALKRLGADKYLGDVSINGTTCAMYFSKNPDRSKGHKPYVTLGMVGETLYIGGYEKEDAKKYTKIEGIMCHLCGDIIYSPHVHGMIYCGCKKCFVDGGREYLRIGGEKKDYTICDIDLMTGKVTEGKDQ